MEPKSRDISSTQSGFKVLSSVIGGIEEWCTSFQV